MSDKPQDSQESWLDGVDLMTEQYTQTLPDGSFPEGIYSDGNVKLISREDELNQES